MQSREEIGNVNETLEYWEESLRLSNGSSKGGGWRGLFKRTIAENFSNMKKDVSQDKRRNRMQSDINKSLHLKILQRNGRISRIKRNP